VSQTTKNSTETKVKQKTLRELILEIQVTLNDHSKRLESLDKRVLNLEQHLKPLPPE
jgi:hypothetical protein